MNKIQLSKAAVSWLSSFLSDYYGNSVDEFRIYENPTTLSKLSDDALKRVEGYTNFDFAPDILGVVELVDGTVELILVNRTSSAISLKEIGEIHLYSKVVKPRFAMIVSSKGLPSEVQLILFNADMQQRLLYYDNERSPIMLFKMESNSSINELSIFPAESREILLGHG